MFFINQSENPMNYMSNLWTVLVVVLIGCIVLVFALRPLHRIWTDRKTRNIIEESGGPAPGVRGGQQGHEEGPAEDEPGPGE
jgi:hypothetical protein